MRTEHPWNSTQRLTSAYPFNLTRHSDHHLETQLPYDRLEALPAAPALPAGYPTMMLVSLVPPLWFRIMDRRAAAVANDASSQPPR